MMPVPYYDGTTAPSGTAVIRQFQKVWSEPFIINGGPLSSCILSMTLPLEEARGKIPWNSTIIDVDKPQCKAHHISPRYHVLL